MSQCAALFVCSSNTTVLELERENYGKQGTICQQPAYLRSTSTSPVSCSCSSCRTRTFWFSTASATTITAVSTTSSTTVSWTGSVRTTTGWISTGTCRDSAVRWVTSTASPAATAGDCGKCWTAVSTGHCAASPVLYRTHYLCLLRRVVLQLPVWTDRFHPGQLVYVLLSFSPIICRIASDKNVMRLFICLFASRIRLHKNTGGGFDEILQGRIDFF